MNGIRFLRVVLFVCALAPLSFSQGSKGDKGGVDHKARQTRPIQLGTSGGNARDLANGYCCSGTLGALVESGGTRYVLSNSHVLAGDSTPGGNGRVSTLGDPVNQPGLIDVSCRDITADYVANLSGWSVLNPNGFSGVDAAIARVVSGTVSSDGAILEIGTISSSIAEAVPGLNVKKSGRTTGLTRSVVDSVNATVRVQYSDECAGSSFTTTFTGQILIRNRGSRFLNSGDSGSLLVEDISNNPRAVGLLFAGSSSIAVANPIADALSIFGATLVGTAATSGSAGDDLVLRREVARAMRAQQVHAQKLSNVPRGVGHAVAVGPSGVVIQVLVEEVTPEALTAVPRDLDGFRVVVEEVGRIVAN